MLYNFGNRWRVININMIEFFIAKKHILERKRQSIIAILGVAIGVTVLTVSIGIANGLDKNMVDSILFNKFPYSSYERWGSYR